MHEGDPRGASAPGDPVLELRGVSRQFGAVRALTDVSFDCLAGEVHAVVGENGSGKSTLLGIASGYLAPDEGSVHIGGTTLHAADAAFFPVLCLNDRVADGTSQQKFQPEWIVNLFDEVTP